MFPVLETERLSLREITEEDAEDIFLSLSRDDVTRYYGQEPLKGIDDAKQMVAIFAKNYTEKRGIRWGIERKGEKGLIGTIGFHAWMPKHRRAEIGYELHPEYWRKGYASEAIAKVISYGFEDLELFRIGAIVYIDNEASNQLLEKMGFQKEGQLRGYMYQSGTHHDTYVYSLIK